MFPQVAQENGVPRGVWGAQLIKCVTLEFGSGPPDPISQMLQILGLGWS